MIQRTPKENEGTVRLQRLLNQTFKVSAAYILDLGLSQHCCEDNIILEPMIVATIVTIVAKIKKIAKLAILKAKFKEINHII